MALPKFAIPSQPQTPKPNIRYNPAMNRLPEPEIVYQQRGIIVFNKPPGVLTQAPPGIDSLELRARQYLTRDDPAKSKIYLTPIHRLDRPVSGLVVFARNVRAAKRVSAQFQNRTVLKKYLARVQGRLAADPAGGSVTLENFMRKIPDEAKSETVAEDHPDAKHAALKYEVRETGDESTLVEIELLTGRTHQIRLQFSDRGHPVLGDSLYDAAIEFGEQTIDLRQRQIALHAWRIEFDHPIDDERVELTIDPPWPPLANPNPNA